MRIRDLNDPVLSSEISDLIENASAGTTSAAAVATSIGAGGGLGAGFDPDGDWGIYTKPKKREKPKAKFIKRA